MERPILALRPTHRTAHTARGTARTFDTWSLRLARAAHINYLHAMAPNNRSQHPAQRPATTHDIRIKTINTPPETLLVIQEERERDANGTPTPLPRVNSPESPPYATPQRVLFCCDVRAFAILDRWSSRPTGSTSERRRNGGLSGCRCCSSPRRPLEAPPDTRLLPIGPVWPRAHPRWHPRWPSVRARQGCVHQHQHQHQHQHMAVA